MTSAVLPFGKSAGAPDPAIPGYPYAEVPASFPGAAFATTRGGVLRTVGLCCVLPARSPKLEQWSASDAQAVSRLFDPFPENRKAAARGKLVLIDQGGDANGYRALCYQVKDNSAEAVWCGNSMSATAALLARHGGKSDFTFDVLSQNVPAKARARVTQKGHRYAVQEEWAFDQRADVEHKTVNGFEAVQCTFLNPYLVLKAPIATDASKIFTDFAAIHGPQQSRVLVVDPSTTPCGAYFYNCNGRHGAAPMTGLITLGYLRTQVKWIADAIKNDEIMTPSGVEYVPEVSLQGAKGVAATLPDVDVELHAVHYGLW